MAGATGCELPFRTNLAAIRCDTPESDRRTGKKGACF